MVSLQTKKATLIIKLLSKLKNEYAKKSKRVIKND